MLTGFRISMILGICALAALAWASDDLPVDTSTIDSFVQKLGGKIPFPPEELVKQIEAQGGSVTGYAIFPNGRSLERKVTSYSQPRTVFTVTMGPLSGGIAADPSKVIFIAYTPGNRQLQIIGAGKSKPFDFRVVNDYQTGNVNPKPDPAPNIGLCLACHQNGEAIFPKFPWSETQNNPRILNKLLHQPNLDSFAKFALNREGNNATTHGPNFVDGEMAPTDLASRLEPTNISALCRNICGGSIACRRALLSSAVLSTALDLKYYSNEKLIKIADILDRSLRRDLILESDALLEDRDSFGNEGNIQTGNGNDPLLPRVGIPQFRENNGALEDSLTAAHDLKLTSSIGTPTEILLQLIRGASTLINNCISLNDMNSIPMLRSIDNSKLEKAIDSPGMDKLVQDGPWPPSADEILGALKNDGNPSAVNKTSLVATDKWSTPDSFEAPFRAFMSNRTGKVAIPHSNVGQLYAAYCASCHAGSASLAPTLPLGKMGDLRSYVGTAGRTVKQMLESPNKIMPPPGALMPTEAERNEMLHALQTDAPVSAKEMATQTCIPPGSATQPSLQAQSLATVQQAANFGVCLGCHSGSGPMPPYIPFSNPDEFKKALSKNAIYSSGTLYDALIYRISTPGPDHMPIGGKLTDDEKSSILSYLKSLIGQ